MESGVRRAERCDLEEGQKEVTVTQIWLKRVGNALYPDGDASIDALSLLPFGRPLRGEIDQPRNLKHHKLFFALCARIAKGIGKDAEFVERAFKIETGHFAHYTLANGRDVVVLGSIAFHKFDQVAFDAFWKECLDIMYRIWRIDPKAVADLIEKDNRD